jgi:hypothetical protein
MKNLTDKIRRTGIRITKCTLVAAGIATGIAAVAAGELYVMYKIACWQENIDRQQRYNNLPVEARPFDVNKDGYVRWEEEEAYDKYRSQKDFEKWGLLPSRYRTPERAKK